MSRRRYLGPAVNCPCGNGEPGDIPGTFYYCRECDHEALSRAMAILGDTSRPVAKRRPEWEAMWEICYDPGKPAQAGLW